MKRIDRILKNKKYAAYMKKTEDLEKERIFCRHNMGHCLDVARITMFLINQERLDIDKETVYAAALLHDIGRCEGNKDHSDRSCELAKDILNESGFDKTEISLISEAIKAHGDSRVAGEKSFRGIFYRADKLSRPCFCCKAKDLCNWDENKKNKSIVW